MCITFAQRRPNFFNVGPTLYKCYAHVLCLLGSILKGSDSDLTSDWPIGLRCGWTAWRIQTQDGMQNKEVKEQVDKGEHPLLLTFQIHSYYNRPNPGKTKHCITCIQCWTNVKDVIEIVIHMFCVCRDIVSVCFSWTAWSRNNWGQYVSLLGINRYQKISLM